MFLDHIPNTLDCTNIIKGDTCATHLKKRTILSDQKKTVQFKDNYNSDTLFITKMGRTLLPKFPRDQDERLWKYIRVLLLGEGDDADIDDPLLIRPPPMIPTTDTASNAASLASMTLNGGSSVSANGNNQIASAGVTGPRHTIDKPAPMNEPSNSSKSKVCFIRFVNTFRGKLKDITLGIAQVYHILTCTL